MARKQQPETTNLLADQAVALAEFAAKALVTFRQLGITKNIVERFPLNNAERTIVASLPALSASLKNRVVKAGGAFTLSDIATIVMALSESLLEGEPLYRLTLLVIAKKLTDCMQSTAIPAVEVIPGKSKPSKASKPTDALYQFKITLLGITPEIWRRIQVKDCTLDKLHEHIQTAMGWTNSHLHHFYINEERYGDSELLDDGFEEFEGVDSTKTRVSKILPKKNNRFVFMYEYDFGDGWAHEVLFEGCPPVDSKAKYPLCLEGERACPPEDCGGVWGYGDFIKAISDKSHAEHKDMLEWVGGRFDPEEFDPVAATKEMKKGLPDWRRMT